MDFAIRLLVGFFLGVGIGIERQWLRSRAILKTNVLVTLGAAMFVMLSIMTPGDASPTRISAQIVSGVGFLGGGVILREGASVRGTNTAATLWCAAAIGTLVGSGYLLQAYLGTFAVVSANLLLRPLVEAFRQQGTELDYQPTTTAWNQKSESEDEIVSSTDDDSYISPKFSNIEDIDEFSELPLTESSNSNIHYSCYLTCEPDEEARIIAILFQSAKESGWRISQLNSKNVLEDKQSDLVKVVQIKANFIASDDYKSQNVEKMMNSLKTNSMVDSVSWQLSF